MGKNVRNDLPNPNLFFIFKDDMFPLAVRVSNFIASKEINIIYKCHDGIILTFFFFYTFLSYNICWMNYVENYHKSNKPFLSGG